VALDKTDVGRMPLQQQRHHDVVDLCLGISTNVVLLVTSLKQANDS
jgi:hypothetical protein